ncbi:hypothetical protein FQN60_006000, partial [Etheostoma spectabile]
MEQLMDEVKNVCGLSGNFRLQYQDRDFGDALVNLTSTAELEDLATIKVIPVTDECSQVITLTVCDEIVSSQSDDTELLSTPSSSVSTRTQMWPREFLIPTFSYDSELQLEKGNAVFRSNNTRLTLILANSLKSKAPEDGFAAKNIKRPKRGEANHIPDIPNGETPDKLENERLSLLTEATKRNNRAINAEFMRITTVPLQPRFLASLDKHHSKLIEIIRKKGGVVREKTRNTLNVVQKDEAQTEVERSTMA